jgi:polar amino acid transport system permease protein
MEPGSSVMHVSEGTGEEIGRPEVTRVVPIRHPFRWISAAGVLFVAVLMALSLARNENIEWSIVGTYFTNDLVLRGVTVTVQLSVVSMAVGIVLGTLIAVLRLSRNPVVRTATGVYVWFFRGTPLLVQLIFWFNLGILFPILSLGIPFTSWNVSVATNSLITPFNAAILGLGLNQAAYYSETVRAGILSVDRGQLAAASSLGLTFGQTMRRIVLPQAMRVIIPPTGNDFITMLKTTALVSVIGGNELLNTVGSIYSRTFRVMELLIVATLWYLVLTSVTSVGQYFLERRFARGVSNPLHESGLFLSVVRQLGRLRRDS